MKILFAPDSFKGSMSAVRFAEIAQKVCGEMNTDCVAFPMADGGEGTAEVIVRAAGGEMRKTEVTAPYGKTVSARYGMLKDGTAVMEMAEASGLILVKEDKKDIFKASTYGTGQLIKTALDGGAKNIIIGIGGSATNDGGMGMLKALGVVFKGEDGILTDDVRELLRLYEMDFSGLDKRLYNVNITVASDVENPMCGQNGASNVFGRQKGAKDEDIEILDKALENLALKAEKATGKRIIDAKGAGAAGGIGGALMLLPNVTFEPGYKVVSRLTGIEKLMETGDFDLVITGEGQLNFQSVMGKHPVEIAKSAAKYGIKTTAVVGSLGEGWQKAERYFERIYTLKDDDMSVGYAITHAEELLEKTLKKVIKHDLEQVKEDTANDLGKHIMFHTARCILKNLEEQHIDWAVELFLSPEVRKYLGGVITEEEARDKIKRWMDRPDDIYFSVFLKKNGKFIGIFSASQYYDKENTEISYQLLPEYWQMGYATEALWAIMKYCRDEIHKQRVFENPLSKNKRSCIILERAGFVLQEKLTRYGEEQSVYVVEFDENRQA